MLTCVSRYSCFTNDLLYGSLSHIINSHVKRLTGDDTLGCATFLRELVMIRDGFLVLSDGLELSNEEVEDIIQYVCVNPLAAQTDLASFG